MKQASGRAQFRRALRRNRALLITLLVVGALVAVFNGIGGAQGDWNISANTTIPDSRYGAATTYDHTTQAMLMFGGFVGTRKTSDVGIIAGPPILTSRETWLLKTSNGEWQRRDPYPAPSQRGFAAIAYDAARKNVVLFGGAPYRKNLEVSAETWTWDGQDWTLQHPPEPLPDPRQNAAMVYDPHHDNGVVMMFGGRGADNKPMNDTWVWNGSSWKIMPSEGAPSPRHSAAIAYDLCRAEAVMFGGVGPANSNGTVTQPSETWTWNGSQWTQRSPLLSAPGRIGATMGYSWGKGRVLLYGGLATTDAGVPTVAADTDVWRWNGDAPPGTGHGGLHTGWERMNSELTTAATTFVFGAVFATPPPRAYANAADFGGPRQGWSPGDSGFDVFGGTPTPDSELVYSDHVRYRDTNGSLVAGFFQGDISTDNPVLVGGALPFTEPSEEYGGGSASTPLTRRCKNPVPLPAEEEVRVDETEEKVETAVRKGVRELDSAQFPVLTGTEWFDDSRHTNVYAGSNQYKPNPKYMPPPECPNTQNYTNFNKPENGSNTFLFVDKKRNRIYQFFHCDYDRGSNGQGQRFQRVNRMLIEARDATTLEVLAKTIAEPMDHDSKNADSLLENNLLHDADRGLFYIHSRWQTMTPGGSTEAVYDEWAVLNQNLIEQGKNPLVRRSPFTQVNSGFRSLFTHPKSKRPKLLVNRGGSSSIIAQVDFDDQKEDWSAQATGCASTGALKPMRSGNNVYIGCAGAAGGTNKMGVVRIPIIENSDGSETPGTPEVFPGPFNVSNSWADPDAERLILLSRYGGTQVWVFDGKTSRYVGFAGISAGISTGGNYQLQFGFDDEAGRLYIHMPDAQLGSGGAGSYKDQGGVLMVDTRLTPVPQALKFPQFASFGGIPVETLRGGPDVPRRIITRNIQGTMRKYPDGEAVKFDNEMFYRVLGDEVPIPNEAEISDLDALTLGIPEASGKTEAFFDAEGSGYGIRFRALGGVFSAAMPFQQIYQGVVDPFLSNMQDPRVAVLVPTCIFPDRELMTGWVPAARLSDMDAVARSAGLEVDSNTKVDLEGPFSRCNPTLEPSGIHPGARAAAEAVWPMWQMAQFEGNQAVGPQLAWDQHFKQVECVGDALTTHQASVGNVYGSAECVKRDGLVRAIARGSASGSGSVGASLTQAGFSVGEGYSNVSVARDPEKGVVVTSVAVAKGIQIPGLSIDRVQTKAVAWSNGRPSDELRTEFVREICGVVTPDYSNSKCLSVGEQKQFVDNWNARWTTNSKIFLPTPDETYYRGSPGGYIAGVIKPIADEVEDQLFAKDYQKEVPGLVIEFYKESTYLGRNRQALMLAATRAVAGFGVQCNTDLAYSASAKSCVEPVYDEDPVEEEEEFEEEFTEEEVDDGGFWTEPIATTPLGASLGSRIGRILEGLPVLSGVPVREVGEALLLGSVWVLLGLPLLFAYRRLSLDLTRRS